MANTKITFVPSAITEAWDNIEISQVYENTDENYCEKIDDPTDLMLANISGYPVFWSVYLHLVSGVVVCVADIETEEQANDLADLIRAASEFKFTMPEELISTLRSITDTEVLTLQMLKDMDDDHIIATGEIENAPEGLFMTSDPKHLGRKITWVAVRGSGYHDWAILAHWSDGNTIKFISEYGDKVTSEANIRKLVPCDDEAFNMYRF